jgi:hypothetical protein
MRFLVVIALVAGCSFTLQPKPSLDPHARRPTLGPIVVDASVAAAATGLAAVAAGAGCSGDFCGTFTLPYAYAAGAVAVGFALSAIYGYTRYASHNDEPAKQLAGRALADARRGDCTTAAESAATLEGMDRGVFDLLAADPSIHACLQRSCEARRRAQLDQARDIASDSQRVMVLRELPACDR